MVYNIMDGDVIIIADVEKSGETVVVTYLFLSVAILHTFYRMDALIRLTWRERKRERERERKKKATWVMYWVIEG